MPRDTLVTGRILQGLSADLKAVAEKVERDQARYLVNEYYSMQNDRKRKGNQLRAMLNRSLPEDTELDDIKLSSIKDMPRDEPISLMYWFYKANQELEKQVAEALEIFAQNHRVGRWCMNIHGIGPIISAGLLAHIDIERAPTAGHIWSFAGLVPGVKWGKGQKRPWNNDLKTLCFHVGECIIKTKGSEKSFYGPFFDTRKAYETAKNEKLDYKDQAETMLARMKSPDKNSAPYKALMKGMLPKSVIHKRARRWTTKLFLSHLQYILYVDWYDAPPPLPYIIQHGEHNDIVRPPEAPDHELNRFLHEYDRHLRI